MYSEGKKTPSLVEGLAADSSKGVTQKAAFPDRILRYGKAKEKALTISDYISVNQPRQKQLANSLANCGSYLVFRDYHTVGEVRLTKACFCKKHLLCPLCAIRRGAKHLSRYLDRFHEIRAQNPRLKAYLVTFTVKDGDNLKERYEHLNKSLRSYHKRRHRKNASCEALKAHAAVWSFEVKRGSGSGSWHPHAHAIWLCEEPPCQEKISAEWKAITGDSFIVDVRPISQTDHVSGFLEVCKYAVKFSDQAPSDTWHCYETLRGRRLIGSFGGFYGIPEPDDLTDDPLEGLPYIDRFFTFTGTVYREVKHLSQPSG